MAECFTLVAQTAAGIVLGGVAYTVLSRSPAIPEPCGMKFL